MFEKETEQIMKNYKPQDLQPLTIGMDYNFNPFLLEERLMTVDSIPDQELYAILSSAYHTVLSKSFVDNNKVLVARLFTDERFVLIFSQVLMSVNKPFTDEEKVICNKLIYDYYTYAGTKEKRVMGLLNNLCLTINRDVVPGLQALGLPQDIVVRLANARNSNPSDGIVVQRINAIIINSSLDLMTEQMIVNIYECLYNRLTPLFTGVMFDVWDDSEFDDDNGGEVTEEIYGRISLAILDLLEAAPSGHIEQVLNSFTQTRQMLYSDKPIRFNLYSIAASDYSRILEAIDTLKETRGLEVPGR